MKTKNQKSLNDFSKGKLTKKQQETIIGGLATRFHMEDGGSRVAPSNMDAVLILIR